MPNATPSRVCVECGAALPTPKLGRPRKFCAACRPSGAEARERQDPNRRVRRNAHTPNEALFVRLRKHGVFAQLSHRPDGSIEVVRPCADCGETISVTHLGRPRERCDPCREKRRNEAVRLWKEAHAEYAAQWRAEHPDWQREYARANPEKMRSYRRKHDSEHREEVNAKARAWYAAHRDEAREQLRRRRAQNPGKHAEDMRRWRAAHAKPPKADG